MKKTDYIVVGAGLAGILFCELLRRQKKSFVVIDNASIHNTRAPGVPTIKTKKAELQKWLTEEGIDFLPTDYRTKLWEKARNHIKNSPKYFSLDRLVAERRPDITFERLPPYHCEMNAIEPV